MTARPIFGVPCSENNASVIYLPVPWDATTSYGKGAALGPRAILDASVQLDLFDSEVETPYKAGLFMGQISEEIGNWNEKARKEAQKAARFYAQKELGETYPEDEYRKAADSVNESSKGLNRFVHEKSKAVLDSGKILGVIGGDHSAPYGAFQALHEKGESFGILHFDAHLDLRKAYQGFIHSHASIMYNVLEDFRSVERLVQVGIRDFSEEEFRYAKEQRDRVRVFYDIDLAHRKLEGSCWGEIADEIIQGLPQKIWISFDVDGLDPAFCPNTGTPVPGGLSFYEANYLIGAAVKSGRRIIGFDLVEVAPSSNPQNEWDANVGMRLLYKLTGWTLASQGKLRLLR